MRYRIHFTLADGTEDSVVISGGSVEAIRDRADEEVARRGGRDPWSEPA
ncbi:hypothetical protein SEA_GAZEBO_67 [Microbacterium phage Gazebo]|nr:hypothetical protein SEA_GAZEBO_67 [Microbacterium phage Gazebo]